jgi:hypothetical protein
MSSPVRWNDPRHADRVAQWGRLTDAVTPVLLDAVHLTSGERARHRCGTGAATPRVLLWRLWSDQAQGRVHGERRRVGFCQHRLSDGLQLHHRPMPANPIPKLNGYAPSPAAVPTLPLGPPCPRYGSGAKRASPVRCPAIGCGRHAKTGAPRTSIQNTPRPRGRTKMVGGRITRPVVQKLRCSDALLSQLHRD